MLVVGCGTGQPSTRFPAAGMSVALEKIEINRVKTIAVVAIDKLTSSEWGDDKATVHKRTLNVQFKVTKVLKGTAFKGEDNFKIAKILKGIAIKGDEVLKATVDQYAETNGRWEPPNYWSNRSNKLTEGSSYILFSKSTEDIRGILAEPDDAYLINKEDEAVADVAFILENRARPHTDQIRALHAFLLNTQPGHVHSRYLAEYIAALEAAAVAGELPEDYGLLQNMIVNAPDLKLTERGHEQLLHQLHRQLRMTEKPPKEYFDAVSSATIRYLSIYLARPFDPSKGSPGLFMLQEP
jgi:hypothetical protein